MEPLLLRSAVQRDEFPAEVLIKIVDADPDSVGVIHLEGGMHILQYAVRKPLPWEVTVYLLDVAHSYAEHLCSQKEREPLIVTAFKYVRGCHCGFQRLLDYNRGVAQPY